MAQDFYAAFGVGEDETHISTVDADGVALAAIQGLYQSLQEKDARIATLEARVAALENALQKQPQESPLPGGWWFVGAVLLIGLIAVRRLGG
jgi:hypothetical protein